MNISLAFMRLFFVLLSIVFMTSYTLAVAHDFAVLYGILLGLIVGAILIGLDILFRRFNLRSFNTAIIGLFFGYLMAEALLLIFNSILRISPFLSNAGNGIELIKICLYLFGTYLGVIMTLRATDELYVSIPFVRFSQTSLKKKDILVDGSILSDARIIDLATSGLLDHQLIIPRFLIKDLYAQAESHEEGTKQKARRSLEVIKKLENIPSLGLRYHDTDFPDIKDQAGKLVRLARLLDANILTADINRVQMANAEGIRLINLHALSNAMKPITQTGEYLRVKIQRYGKEARQGVGYLDDGTMVVVNGGGEYLGETIEVRVLSVKHTSSGRMIFCNADDQDSDDFDDEIEDE